MANTPDHYHRPELHITAEEGVLFAPAGVLLDGNTWHVFHQYLSSGPGGHTNLRSAPHLFGIFVMTYWLLKVMKRRYALVPSFLAKMGLISISPQ